MSIRDRVAEAQDLTEDTITVPEWDDVKLLLISPTVKARADMVSRYTSWVEDEDGERRANVDIARMMPELLIACVHDPDTREPAFNVDDVPMLSGKNGSVVERIGQKCLPLVGFASESPVEAGKDASSTIRSVGIVSGSPDSSAAP